MRGPKLERYRISGELGQGGMSVVYRARDLQLSREVAVKVLHDFLARQPEARRRFHREAMAVAKLHHPNIVEIFDYSGPDADEAYIVTELIEGETLREHVDRRGRPAYPELGVMLVAELVRALRHAHEQSVLHRDLKPENVMITRSGTLKLMDFGLAQLMDGGTKLTATGTLLGSPAHMAPEVIDGKPSDARADIFSMGTVLYWLTTGALPFTGPNPSALFKRILDGRYDDPQQLEPKVGNGLAHLIRRALEPDPARRYQDVTELEADLELELAEVGLSPAAPEVRRFLLDPEAYARALGPRLVDALLGVARAALAEGNVARATDRLRRVLAIDPEHPEARAALAKLHRRRALARRLGQAGAAALAVGAAALVAWAAMARSGQSVAAGADAVPARVEAAAPSDGGSAPEAAPARREGTPADPVERTEHAPAALALPERASSRPRPRPPLEHERRPGARERPPPAPPEDQAAQPDPGGETGPTPARRAQVQVVVGNGFATGVYVDGLRRALEGNGYTGILELAPGRHRIAVDTARGRSAEKLVEVDLEGRAFELAPSGVRAELSAAGLRLAAPP